MGEYKLGKLNGEELKTYVLDKLRPRRAEVSARARLGGDCAAFSTNDVVLVSTDPITGAVDGIGRLAMQVGFNDVLAAGGTPLAATITVLLPPHETLQTLANLMQEAEEEASRLNVEIVGGHTEFTDAVTRIVVSVTAIGTTKTLQTMACPQAGEAIFLTSYAAIEGTRVLASMPDIRKQLTETEQLEADALADQVGIAGDATLARRYGARALHDVTEGGVLGAVCEMLGETDLGAEIDKESIPVLPVTKRVTTLAGADPYRLLSSGALLVTTPDPVQLQKGFQTAGRMLTRIGTVMPVGHGCILRCADHTEEIKIEADEIYRLMK